VNELNRAVSSLLLVKDSVLLDYYGLAEQPFSETPDRRYFYLSSTHREALTSLYYGIEISRRLLALVAEPGMGKTSLLFRLLERFHGSALTAFVFQTLGDSRQLFRSLAGELGFETSAQDLGIIRQQLNEFLLRQARADTRLVIVIDEAHHLDIEALKSVLLLSDSQSDSPGAVHIILAGQPRLAETLESPSLARLWEHLVTPSRLNALTPSEVERYIDHRLRIAGLDRGSLFTSEACATIAARSDGIPRKVNNLCFNALSRGYALAKKTIDASIIQQIAKNLDPSFFAFTSADGSQPVGSEASAPSLPAAPPTDTPSLNSDVPSPPAANFTAPALASTKSGRLAGWLKARGRNSKT